MSITIYGHSDDCIEVDGDLVEEWYADDDGNVLALSDGRVVRITYTQNGIWRITPVVGQLTTDELTQAPEDNDDNYSDRLTVDGLTWVVCGTGVAK